MSSFIPNMVTALNRARREMATAPDKPELRPPYYLASLRNVREGIAEVYIGDERIGSVYKILDWRAACVGSGTISGHQTRRAAVETVVEVWNRKLAEGTS